MKNGVTICAHDEVVFRGVITKGKLSRDGIKGLQLRQAKFYLPRQVAAGSTAACSTQETLLSLVYCGYYTAAKAAIKESLMYCSALCTAAAAVHERLFSPSGIAGA